jgi:predicted translin family RNA/ssDNA-binding protein
MAKTLVEKLAIELEAIDQIYTTDFANQSRLTRDPDQMASLAKRTQAVIAQVDAIPVAAQGPDLVRLRTAAATNLALYEGEHAAILKAQEVGPAFESFSTEATSANFVFARYGRHFAGHNRATRDTALLGEMVEELKQIDKRMAQILSEKKIPEFEKDREVVRQNLGMYQKEIELIEAAQAPDDADQHASLLADLANNQFALYQLHFAGHPRVSRRPALLMRIVTSLKRILGEMNKLKAGGFSAEYNDKNTAIVKERLATYEAELTEVRKARQGTAMGDIMGELGGAANKLFDEYRTNFADKARTAVDMSLLAGICDRLGEIRRQMLDLSMAEDNEVNARNLEIVTEQLMMFEGEYEAVAQVQKKS